MRRVPPDPALADVGKTVRTMALVVSAIACAISLLGAAARDASQAHTTARAAQIRR